MKTETKQPQNSQNNEYRPKHLKSPSTVLPICLGNTARNCSPSNGPVRYLTNEKGYAVFAALALFRRASAHRFLAAREILARPASESRLCVTCAALAGGFFFTFLAARAFITPVARTTETLAESSNSRNPRALGGHWSMTLVSKVSTLFSRLRAFLIFMLRLVDSSMILLRNPAANKHNLPIWLS